MSDQSLRPLRGIIPPLVTPLNADGSVDLDGLERLVERMIAAGVHGLFPLGTTGEAPHLGRDFRARFLAQVASIVNGRIPLLAGITDCSTDECLWMSVKAAESGYDAVVFAPPHYYPMTQEELTGFVRTLVSRLPLPFFLYNIPFCTRDSFSLDTVRRVAELPNCLGVKDSTGDMELFASLVDAFRGRPDFTVLIGPEERLWEAVRMGAHGGVTGGANLAPELFTAIYAAAVEGDSAKALPLVEQARIISDRIYSAAPERSGYFRGLKCALELCGICQGHPAAPFEPVRGEARERIRTALVDSGLI